MAFDLNGLLQQYIGGAQNGNSSQVENDFQQISQNAPQAAIGSGVAEALRSDQTPPFSQMVGQLFGNGNSHQRAGMLNQLIGGLSPGLLASLGGGLGALFGNAGNPGNAGNSSAMGGLGNLGGLGGLGGLFGGASGGGMGAIPQITPEQAAQLDPQQVQQIAAQAQQQDPGIVDRMGDFYASHPTLVHTLGSAALAIAMGKIAERMRN